MALAQQVALARQLGQAVGPGAGVGAAVEPLPLAGVVEPEVGAAVDDHGLVGKLRGDLRRLAVREAEEDDVMPRERLRGGRLEDPVGERQQVRLQGAEALAGVRSSGERADLHARVAEQESQHLAAGVPAGSGDRYPLRRHVHDYTG